MEKMDLDTGKLSVYLSSRRTIMSGEVVTFATSFEESPGIFGKDYDAKGNFEISASRDAVIIHRASCTTPEDFVVLSEALAAAESVYRALSRNQYGGAPSLYERVPILISSKKE